MMCTRFLLLSLALPLVGAGVACGQMPAERGQAAQTDEAAPEDIEEPVTGPTRVESISRRELAQYPGQVGAIARHPWQDHYNLMMPSVGTLILDDELVRIDIIPSNEREYSWWGRDIAFFDNGDVLAQSSQECGVWFDSFSGIVNERYEEKSITPNWFIWTGVTFDPASERIICMSLAGGNDNVIRTYLHHFALDGEKELFEQIEIEGFEPSALAVHPTQDRLLAVGMTELVVLTLEGTPLKRFTLDAMSFAAGIAVDEEQGHLHITDRTGRDIRTYELSAFDVPDPEATEERSQ